MLFGKLKLTSKLAVIIGAVLAVIFALLIGVTISTTSTSIQKGIAGELSALARTTGTEIQDSFGVVDDTARGIQEYNLLALVVYLISTDVLGNTAGLAGSNVGFADSVQQGGFTMVNVAHNGNNRRTRNAFFRRIVNLGNLCRILFRSLLANFYAEVVADKLCGIEIDILVDGNHYAQHKQSLDYFINLTLNELGKFLYIDGFADFNVGRTNDFYRSLLLLRCGLLAAAVYRHLMAGAAVRTAFAGSVAALNLQLVVLTALACVATALTVIATAFAATATAAFAAATANLCTAFAMYARALLALRTYKDTALALLAVAVTLTVALTALLTVAVLRTAFVTAALAVALLATAVLLRTAFVAATLTIFVTPLLSVVVIALILLLILLHIPLSVIPIHIVIISFSCILRTRRSSRFADITFFRLRRFGRFWFFIVCFTDNRHSLVISCTKISFFDIIFLQQVNYLIYRFAIILGNLIYSFITHSSTSRPDNKKQIHLRSSRKLRRQL